MNNKMFRCFKCFKLFVVFNLKLKLKLLLFLLNFKSFDSYELHGIFCVLSGGRESLCTNNFSYLSIEAALFDVDFDDFEDFERESEEDDEIEDAEFNKLLLFEEVELVSKGGFGIMGELTAELTAELTDELTAEFTAEFTDVLILDPFTFVPGLIPADSFILLTSELKSL